MLSKVLREISLAAKKNGRPTILVLDGDCASGGGWAEVMVGLRKGGMQQVGLGRGAWLNGGGCALEKGIVIWSG
jgi:hypothetical protein